MLGENIRNFRKLNNMSQDELAEKLDVTRQSISLWETGQTQPSLENIVALAKLFGISTDVLLGNENTDNPVSVNNNQTALGKKKAKSKLPLIITIIVAAVVIVGVVVTLLLVKKDNKPVKIPETEFTQKDSETYKVKDTEKEEDTEAVSTADTEKATDTVTPETEPVAKADINGLFDCLKNFAINNGHLNGDYCAYSKIADTYGGRYEDNFNVFYWGDTDKVEISLHTVLDDTYSICYYLSIPKTYTGEYEYITSYYYRDSGESVTEAKGWIKASEFTQNYPLYCDSYYGDTSLQNDFMEMSRVGLCNLLICLDNFLETENIGYAFEDLGFVNF